MEQKPNNSGQGSHNQLPSDETTRNKIDKHLSDIGDTISEEDMQNINTNTSEATRDAKKNPGEGGAKKEDEPKKEMPSTWDIIDEE